MARDNPVITIIVLFIMGVAFAGVGQQSDTSIAPLLFWIGVACIVGGFAFIAKLIIAA